jgi:hypothetical protein
MIDKQMILTSVSAIIYLLLVTGLFILFRKKIERLLDIFKSRYRLRPERGVSGNSFIGLDRLLKATMKKPVSATVFLVFTLILFFTVFIASAKTIPIGFAVLTGVAFAGLPYLFLRVKLERLRRVGSFEGEKLVSAFMTAYLITGGNIYETLERSIETCSHLKVTTKLMSDLLLDLRKTADPTRIKTATKSFAYGVGTNWASMLAYAIETAAQRGVDVTPAIEDVLTQLREARLLAEERRRINSESTRITAFLSPGLYIGSIVVAISVMGLPVGRLLHNQFFTPQGFALFTAGLFLFLINKVLIEIIANRKLDF